MYCLKATRYLCYLLTKARIFVLCMAFEPVNLILFSIKKTKSRYILMRLRYGNNVLKWFISLHIGYHCRSSDYSYNVLYLQLTRNLWPLEVMLLTQSSKTCVEKHRPTLRQWLQIKWLVKIYLICFFKII